MPWEFDILYAIQEWHGPMLDKVMVILSTLGDGGILWIALALLLIAIPSTRKGGIQMMIAIVLTFIVGNLILKNCVDRLRPCQIDETVALLVRIPSDSSFPSGHTMNSITAATSLCLYNWKAGVPAMVLALLIAFSRLYNFVHFPTDVLAGIVVGVCGAFVAKWLVQKKWKREDC